MYVYKTELKVLNLFSLDHRSGKTIQEKSIPAFWFIQIWINHIHNKIIGYKFSIIHDFFKLGAKLRTRRDFRA